MALCLHYRKVHPFFSLLDLAGTKSLFSHGMALYNESGKSQMISQGVSSGHVKMREGNSERGKGRNARQGHAYPEATTKQNNGGVVVECNKEKNLTRCNCTYDPCSRKGICCECISYHLKMRELPGCVFSEKAEATYDRSFEHFARLVQSGKI